MAEKRHAGVHSDEALTKVSKEGHAWHGIWRKIQKVEAIGVHDVIEEI